MDERDAALALATALGDPWHLKREFRAARPLARSKAAKMQRPRAAQLTPKPVKRAVSFPQSVRRKSYNEAIRRQYGPYAGIAMLPVELTPEQQARIRGYLAENATAQAQRIILDQLQQDN